MTKAMRIACCWSELTGYNAACWRELATRPGVDLLILTRRQPNFDDRIAQGVPAEFLTPEQSQSTAFYTKRLAEYGAHAVTFSGWNNPGYRGAALSRELRDVGVCMVSDTPWRNTLRQHLGRWRHAKYFRRIDACMVPGARGWPFAKLLGLPESKIRLGTLACDERVFQQAVQARNKRHWPKRFLYLGRYVPAKALDVLLDAYAVYRGRVADPWPLTCCGAGPLGRLLQSAEGVTNRGFVQPPDLPSLMAEHGVFVLPSRHEPWGVVIAEAATAGMPIVCSQACGASADLVLPYFNGLTCATENTGALADSLVWMHEHHDKLPEMGRRSTEIAAAFSTEVWADRWIAMLRASIQARRA